jgi:hypothetical protein
MQKQQFKKPQFDGDVMTNNDASVLKKDDGPWNHHYRDIHENMPVVCSVPPEALRP